MRIFPEHTCALLIDVQERLFPHMFERTTLERNLPILLRGLEALEVPLLVTQQYTKGLGSTIPEIRNTLGWNVDGSSDGGGANSHGDKTRPYIEKIAFSCWGEPAFREALEKLERKQVVLFGIEAHVCVLQTAVDLNDSGYTPVVIEDCTSSRRESDKRTALRRLQHEGIPVSSLESILFELMQEAGTDTFRAISRLVK
jgi:nicotinamidase-related amidase